MRDCGSYPEKSVAGEGGGHRGGFGLLKRRPHAFCPLRCELFAFGPRVGIRVIDVMDTGPDGPFDEPLERGCACLIEDQGAQIVRLCLEANPVISLFALNQINAVPFLGNAGTLHLKSRQREVRHIHRAPDGTQFRCLGADILAAATLAEQFIDTALFERSLGIPRCFFRRDAPLRALRC